MNKKKATHPFFVTVSNEEGKQILKQRFRVRWKAENQLNEWKDKYKDYNYTIKIGDDGAGTINTDFSRFLNRASNPCPDVDIWYDDCKRKYI